MRDLILCLIVYCLFGCSAKKDLACNENEQFRVEFFKKIQFIEDHTLRLNEEGDFIGALDFIAQYVNVSYEKIYNYEVRYLTLEVFDIDKTNWLKWYGENKCNNIQIK